MDNAFEKARAAYGSGAYDDATLEFLFPQLKESEEERIRKTLVKYFKRFNPEDMWNDEVSLKDIVAYLEKQKEQKPAWSEEDEENFKWFDKFFCAESIVLGGKDIPQDKYLWFKSLRPSWKPSEEHLGALLAVFNDPNNIGSQTCQLALTDLYEQLKKLGVKEEPEYYQHFDPDC